ncbi:hypothetical protein NADFUDRAFT_52758 [Nadsonia fulvescens var. elongata DSM 6958]|uniref:Mmc1 C-terminal domain-containing protein n=1 Tax=Nadsonia fulvescens var. elongata DSM 6958 TaxID=857566 RepID=A0A1E3PHL1_9ASCO|nr:hypothetical protein NADFUDRAFT_52758 [Nadsonia fulvescens var. elongata DSM 6958]
MFLRPSGRTVPRLLSAQRRHTTTVQGSASSLTAHFHPSHPSHPSHRCPTPSAPSPLVPPRPDLAPDLVSTLDNLVANFPNHQSIHTRLLLLKSTLENPRLPLRVALVPHGSTSRPQIKSLLDAALADPLASDQTWYNDHWLKRILQKDALVAYGPFAGTETHNSRVQFTVPSPLLTPRPARHGRPLQILEATSVADSVGNIALCHYTILVTNDIRALSSPLPEPTAQNPALAPALMVLDLDTLTHKIDLGPHVVVLSSRMALDAVRQIKLSTANATAYTSLWTNSNIDQLIHRLSDSPSLNSLTPLLVHLSATLHRMATDPARASHALAHEDLMVRNLTRDWAKHAHQERQSVLQPCLQWWAKKSLPWYKLYYRIGDVRAATENMLIDSYLPGASYRLGYLLGRIDHYTTTQNPSQSSTDELLDLGIADLTEGKVGLSSVIVDSRSELIAAPAHSSLPAPLAQLEDSARSILATTILAIQVPTFLAAATGYFQYSFSLYSMTGVFALGTVVGLMYLQRAWGIAIESFQKQVLQQASQAIAQAENVAHQRWSESSKRERNAVAVRNKLLETFDSLVKMWK